MSNYGGPGNASIAFTDGTKVSRPLLVPGDSVIELDGKQIHLDGKDMLVYWDGPWKLNGADEQPRELLTAEQLRETSDN